MRATRQVIVSHSPDETRELGRRLGSDLRGGEALLLRGTLGAGKSVLARGVGEALGVTVWRGSPTFALVNEYDTAPALYHIDLYRLVGDEIEDLGLEDYARLDAVLLVEWADRASALLTALAQGDVTWVDLTISGPDERTIEISSHDRHIQGYQ